MRVPVRLGVRLAVCIAAAARASAQTDADWLNPAGGDWFAPANWSGGRVPDNAGGETFHARVALPAAAPYTVGLARSATIDSLTLDAANATLRASAGTFRVLNTANVAAGTFQLDGATLAGGIWSVAPAATARVSNLSTLDGVTWNGDLGVSTAGAILRIQNGLTLGGQLALTAATTSLVFDGNQTISGGTVLLNPTSGSATISALANANLVLSPTTIVRGGGASLTGEGAVVNHGTIRADRGGQTLTVAPASFTNHGLLDCVAGGRLSIGATTSTWRNAAAGRIAANGATLDLRGDWINDGAIDATNATVTLAGSFDTSSLARVNLTGGTVQLAGTLDNTGASYAISPASGPWTFRGGQIVGGSFAVPDGTSLNVTGSATSFLTGVAFVGAVSLGSDARLRVDADSTHPSQITFTGALARISLSGHRRFDGLPVNLRTAANTISVDEGGSLTLGPSQQLDGSVSILGGAGVAGTTGSVRNEGSIRGGAGQVVQVNPTYFENAGLCESVGGTMSFGSITAPINSWENLPGGAIRVTNGTLDLNGNWSNAGTIEATNSTVNLRGAFRTADLTGLSRQDGVVNLQNCVLDNTNAQLALNQQTGNWNLIGATIHGGVMNLTAGGTLTFDHTSSSSTPVTTFRDIAVHGDLNLRSTTARTAALYMCRDATLDGTMTLGAFGSLRLQTGRTWFTPITFAASATLSADEPGEIAFAPGTLIAGGFGGTMSFTQGATAVNHGVIRSDRRMESLTLAGDLINEGVIEAVNEGRLNVSATSPALWRNAAGGEVSVGPGSMLSTSGEWQNHGLISVTDGEAILRFAGTTQTRNAGTIDATNARITVSGGFRNDGTLRLSNCTTTFTGSQLTRDLVGIERTGGTLILAGTLDNHGQAFVQGGAAGPWLLSTGGRILGGVIDQRDGARLQFSTNTPAGVLDGVTVNGNIELAGAVRVENGLTIDGGIMRILSSGNLYLPGARVFDAVQVEFDGSVNSPARLTAIDFQSGRTILGPTFVARGGGGWISNDATSQAPSLTNRGTIVADRALRSIRITARDFENEGIVGAAAGGTLELGIANRTWRNTPDGRIEVVSATIRTEGDWINEGVFTADNASIFLAGNYASSELDRIQLVDSSLFIRGSVDNAQHTVRIDADRSSAWFVNATITGGSIRGAPAAPLRMGDATLRSVELQNVDAVISSTRRLVAAESGIRLSDVYFGSAQSTVALRFNGTQTIDGDGEIVVTSAGQQLRLELTSNSTLTIGDGITVRGGTFVFGSVDTAPINLVNRGVVSADVQGERVSVFGQGATRITNDGVFSARNGGTLMVSNPNSLTNRVGNALIGGRWEVYADSTIDLPSISLAVNAADVLLSGPASEFAAFNAFGTNEGRFAITDGRDFTTTSDLTNNGLLHAGPGSTFNVAGDFTQSNPAMLELVLAGLDAQTQFGNLGVAGVATLDGRLSVLLRPSFSANFGDRIDIIRAAAVTGQFSDAQLPPLGGLFFEVRYTADAVQLVVVPEPVSGLMIPGVLAAIGLRRRLRS
ncbi:MAG: beta strand repeat-containing protein [Phycisphaerae bacterium]